MKKLTPYIFPLVVILIVFFLVYRWYGLRTNRAGDISQLGEGIQIEDLSSEQADSLLRGSDDMASTPLTPGDATAQETVTGTGTIRYEMVDGKVNFSVMAALPESDAGYTVWIRGAEADNLTQAGELELSKGGYQATVSVNEDQLPLEVLVSQAKERDAVMDSVILRGMIEAQEAAMEETQE